ncbi:MAG: multicopper oxidase domain-containing protein [Thermomicrobiales bacterium]
MDLQSLRHNRSATHLNRRLLLQRAGLGSLTAGMLAATGDQLHTGGDQPLPLTSARSKTQHTQSQSYELIAEEFNWEISSGKIVRAWGYNGQIPGPELRVRENDEIRIRLRNNLPVPTTIHWHGVNVRPAMDGVAGLSQAAIEPGAEFVYEFTATPGGSRWYHSHTDPALQVPMGLYGPLIIEPMQPIRTYDREYTYIFSEWDLELTPDVAAGLAPRGVGDRRMRGGELGSDLFVINGRTQGMIPPIVVSERDRVLIRLINAGEMPHAFHTHGHSFTIVATDGNPVPAGMAWKKDTLLFGPAERYDLELICDNPGVWMVHCHMEHHMANGMMTLLQYEGYQPTGPVSGIMNMRDASSHSPPATPVMPSTLATPEPAALAPTVPSAQANAVEISLVDDRIVPSALTVARGTTVTWVNRGADWHSVAAFDGSFKSDQLAPGNTFVHGFDRPGSFQYLCTHHAMQGMIGRIDVS